MKFSSRGQSSMEYILVVGFSMLFLMALIAVAYSQSSDFGKSASSAQIQRVGSTIVDSVDNVYAAGAPSKKTVKIYFPADIRSVDINGTSITFTVSGEGGDYEYSLSAATNMSGTIRPFGGIHKITVVASGSQVNITDG